MEGMTFDPQLHPREAAGTGRFATRPDHLSEAGLNTDGATDETAG